MLSSRVLRVSLRTRRFSTVSIAEEIREAVSSNQPVVSLESTIITHGLPYPDNLLMAKRVEAEIRQMGAIPATTAFINGVPKVGLSEEEIEALASSSANKVSRRDIPYVMANQLNGGTTISGTMILSQMASIRVFATGGLGGVHRDGEKTMDVSADLDELGRTAVAVVCAGPKSILDIERTMEYLETKGVFAGTMGPQGTNIPGFYTRDSGVKSVYNFASLEEAARIVHQADSMKLSNGQLFCIPPPESVALEPEFINGVIENANLEAVKQGIKGKHLTPFLLSKIAEATKGESVKTNIEFVLNNARAASGISKSLSELRAQSSDPSQVGHQPEAVINRPSRINKAQRHNSVVIGSIALDTYCKMSEVVLYDSNPAQISSSIGGVGYNVARESCANGNDSLKFISAVGDDIYGEKLTRSIEIDNSLEVLEDKNTAQYISSHDAEGALVVASADMGIMESISSEFLESELTSSQPRVVLADCNLSKKTLSQVYGLSERMGFRMVIEPTSQPKAAKVALNNLSVSHPLLLITPTVTELASIYDAMDANGKFDVDEWFPALDSLGLDSALRTRFESLAIKNPYYKDLVKRGIVQMAVSLLPYSENVVVKDGANGVYVFSCGHTAGGDIVSTGASATIKSPEGVLFEHYEPPARLTTVSNVTGAGDALAGVLLKALSQDTAAFKDPLARSRAIMAAQKAAINKIT